MQYKWQKCPQFTNRSRINQHSSKHEQQCRSMKLIQNQLNSQLRYKIYRFNEQRNKIKIVPKKFTREKIKLEGKNLHRYSLCWTWQLKPSDTCFCYSGNPNFPPFELPRQECSWIWMPPTIMYWILCSWPLHACNAIFISFNSMSVFL